MFGLAILAVELPFLSSFLLVEMLARCSHCRHQWLSWPILAGAFPSYHATFYWKLLPRDLTMLQVRLVWSAFTALFITLLFLASRHSGAWRQILAGGMAISIGLALLAYLLIAA